MTKVDIISGFLGAGKTTLISKLLKEALKGEVNRAVFKVKGNTAAVEKELIKHFSKTFTAKTLELNGKEFIYRFQTEGMAIQIKEDWSTYIIEYADLAEIVALMIETEELTLPRPAIDKTFAISICCTSIGTHILQLLTAWYRTISFCLITGVGSNQLPFHKRP